MLEGKRNVNYDDGAVRAQLEIAPATVLTGFRRGVLQRLRDADDPNDVALLRRFTWPDLKAATTAGHIHWDQGEINVSDLTFEQWIELPEALVVEWENVVYEVNPHWMPVAEGNSQRRTDRRGRILSESASSSGTKGEPQPEKNL